MSYIYHLTGIWVSYLNAFGSVTCELFFHLKISHQIGLEEINALIKLIILRGMHNLRPLTLSPQVQVDGWNVITVNLYCAAFKYTPLKFLHSI